MCECKQSSASAAEENMADTLGSIANVVSSPLDDALKLRVIRELLRFPQSEGLPS